MARYNVYIKEININLETGTFFILFDNDNFVIYDRGELAEAIIEHENKENKGDKP